MTFHRFVFAASLLLAAPALSASERPSQEPVAATSASADSTISHARTTDLGTTYLAPIGWDEKQDGALHVYTAPEGDARMAVFESPAGSADEAVAEAWTKLRGSPHAGGTSAERPLRSGWQVVRTYRYPAMPGPERFVLAQALHDGRHWVVMLADLSVPVLSRRESQFTLLLGSLRPRDYVAPARITRAANPLDEARLKTILDFLEQARTAFGIPGIGLGLVQDGDVRFAGGLGVRRLGSEARVDADTVFLSASVTKPLSSLMFARLVDAGRLRWDQPMATLSPHFRVADAMRTRQLQVRHVLCACTGLPRQDAEWVFGGDDMTPEDTLELLATMAPTAGIGELYQYSNPMAAAGSYAIAQATHPGLAVGAAYDLAMQQQVFDPLGMDSTTFDFDAAQRGNHAAPHSQRLDGTTVVSEMGYNVSSIAMRPDGGAWSSVNDLLRYVRMEVARGLLPDGTRYIGETALLERQVGQVARGGMDQWYGMGLKINENQGLRVVTHGGSMVGYQSEIMWLPGHDVGMVLLTNADAGVEVRGLLQDRLLEVLFDLDLGVQARFNARLGPFAAGPGEEAARLQAPLDTGIADGLAPRYRHASLGELRVVREGGVTWLDTGAWRSELAAPRDRDEPPALETVSPGVGGYRFVPGEKDGLRTLTYSDGERDYTFTESRP